MMRRFFIFILFFLTGCVSIYNVLTPTPQEKRTVFIDSNIAADVYIGDVMIGITPYTGNLSGEEREMISLRKTGYKSAELPLKKTRSDFFKILSDDQYVNERFYYRPYYLSSEYRCEQVLRIIKERYNFDSYSLERMKMQCENTDMYQYDRDAYFVEMEKSAE